jgi:uncharacterized membrane protein YczE
MRLKDWLKTGAVHALAAIGGSFMYGVMMYMMDAEFDFSTFVEVSVVYLLFFGAFRGIGIGSVICALINGALIRAFTRLSDRMFEFSDRFSLRDRFEEREEKV